MRVGDGLTLYIDPSDPLRFRLAPSDAPPESSLQPFGTADQWLEAFVPRVDIIKCDTPAYARVCANAIEDTSRDAVTSQTAYDPVTGHGFICVVNRTWHMDPAKGPRIFDRTGQQPSLETATVSELAAEIRRRGCAVAVFTKHDIKDQIVPYANERNAEEAAGNFLSEAGLALEDSLFRAGKTQIELELFGRHRHVALDTETQTSE